MKQANTVGKMVLTDLPDAGYSTSSMEQGLGILGSTLGQMKMSPVEQTEAPRVYQEQTYSSMLQDEKLTSWSSGAAPLIKGLD